MSWLRKVSCIDRFYNNVLLLEAAVVSHGSSNFDPLTHVFSFINWSMIHYNGNALFNIPVVYDDVARETYGGTCAPTIALTDA